jgi:carboxyl-terminal processing protease
LRTIRIDTAQHRGETQRKGIRIDIQVIPTIEGIAKEKDELLEKAVEIINSKN